MKLMLPGEELAKMNPAFGALPQGLVWFIGASEIAGAVGVILPAASRIVPGLTTLAAVGLTAIMLMATVFHLSRGEMRALPTNLALGGLALFVAWGRMKKVPIPARS